MDRAGREADSTAGRILNDSNFVDATVGRGPGSTIPTTSQSVAQFLRRCAFRDSSVASRIGRMDFGTQRCAELNFLHADAAQLFLLDAKANGRSLFVVDDCVRVRADVETDARDDAGGLTVVGLLAALQNANCETRSAK